MNKNTICICTRLIQSLRYIKNDEWQMSRYQEKPSRINVRHTKYWMGGEMKWRMLDLSERPDCNVYYYQNKNITALVTNLLHLFAKGWFCNLLSGLKMQNIRRLRSVDKLQKRLPLSRCRAEESVPSAFGTRAKGSLGMTYSWSGAHRLRVPPLVTLDRLWDLWGWLQA